MTRAEQAILALVRFWVAGGMAGPEWMATWRFIAAGARCNVCELERLLILLHTGDEAAIARVLDGTKAA